MLRDIKTKRYFREVPGCTDCDVINLETLALGSVSAMRAATTVHYLEESVQMLPDRRLHEDLLRRMRLDPASELSMTDHNLSDAMCRLIRSLVLQLHQDELAGRAILIFIPTYRQLEQVYTWLAASSELRIHVLHSPVDVVILHSSVDVATLHSSVDATRLHSSVDVARLHSCRCERVLAPR